jgi:DNA-binding NarL/FixJ family response regulator
MDINLPGMSGIEATRRIVAARPDVAVVLLSTYQADDLPADARHCGAAGYVRKEDLTPQVLRQILAAR